MASRRYPGLTTRNTRTTYELSDFPMPSDYPEWPSGEQVQVYMQSYVDHYQFQNSVNLNTEVVKAVFDGISQKWSVQTVAKKEDDSFSDSPREFDYLIVSNGIFSIPSIPNYKGAYQFIAGGGRICHTSEFIDIEDSRDKNVLIVGYGKSSCDVAIAVSGVAASTTVVVRDLIWKIPKMIANKLNFKHLFLSRMSEALFRYIHLRGMDKFFHTWGNPIRLFMLSSVEKVVEKQLRLSCFGLHPNKPLETIERSTVSLVSDGFYESVESGEIKVYKYSEIVALIDGHAELSDGEKIPVDLIVCGTGWYQRCPFLEDSVLSKVTDEQGNFRLYRSILLVDVPRLAFDGYNSSFFSQLNCEIGALWLADYLGGGFELPSEVKQNKDIDERLVWMEERTDGKHSKGTNIIPFSIHHIDGLLSDMGMNVGRFTRFTQWLGALHPKVYRHILPTLQKNMSVSLISTWWMNDQFDYVIVGSGINSLCCAVLLAKKGRSICILERNDYFGGCIKTEGVNPSGVPA